MGILPVIVLGIVQRRRVGDLSRDAPAAYLGQLVLERGTRSLCRGARCVGE
jgi:hypothetical protein